MERHVPDQQTFLKRARSGERGVIAAQHGEAARIGADILAAGGNAIDAAIAVSFALGVVEPWMSGIGGGGFMVVREPNGEARSLDFNMRSPAALDVSAYPLAGGTVDGIFPWPGVKDNRNLQGPLSIAVPGQVAGMEAAHRRWGSVPWSALLQPSVQLARDGLCVDWYTILHIGGAAGRIAKDPESTRLFLPGGYPPTSSNNPAFIPRLRNARLADTLESIRSEGPASFRMGDVGAALTADVETLGGFLRRTDLASFQAEETPALPIPFRDATIHAAQGLSGGPTLAHAIGELVRRIGAEPAQTQPAALFLAIAPSLRNAFRHRLAQMGDSAPGTGDLADPPCTSHLSIIDGNGMAVALTQTLLSVFGSAVTSPATGVLLNNGVYWFDPRPGGPNSLGPGKRCLANMCPIVAERRDGSVIALGASGGRRIIPAVLQTASLMIECGMNLEDALHHPRIDASDNVLILDSRLDPDIVTALQKSSPVVEKPDTIYPSWFANVSGAEWRDGIATGAVQPSLPWGEAMAA